MDADKVVDAKGLACPMPLVKARQAINELEPGEILKVISTDRGSVKDFQGWAKMAKNLELVAQETENDLYIHYINKIG